MEQRRHQDRRPSPDATAVPAHEVSVWDLIAPLVQHWRLIAITLAAVWGVALAIIFIPPRKYEAAMVLAAVPNTRSAGLSSGLSALVMSGQTGGVQATPYFIAKLLHLRSVVYGVALGPSTARPNVTVIERALDRPLNAIQSVEIERTMKRVLTTDVDKQTGLITVGVVHSDSALAREIATKLVEVASQAFVRAVRGQATEQRRAQGARVDSAARLLRSSEERLLAFVSANREFTSYSVAAVERQRLERELSNAQAVYAQAIADREQAVARELEETPAVVVVDPIPAELTPVPRQSVLKMFLATFLGVAIAVALIALRARPAAWFGHRPGDRPGVAAASASRDDAPDYTERELVGTRGPDAPAR